MTPRIRAKKGTERNAKPKFKRLARPETGLPRASARFPESPRGLPNLFHCTERSVQHHTAPHRHAVPDTRLPHPARKETTMSRITTPATIAAAPAASQPQLEAVQKQLGSVPNMFRLFSNSPASLQGYLSLNGALAHGTFNAAAREKLALAVSQANGCSYCLSAHTYLGINVAKADAADLASSREARSTDPKLQAALEFAVKVVRERGHVSEADLRTLLAAGYTEAQAVEIVAHVALDTLTNYVNSAFGTDIDFPVVEAGVLQ